MEAAEAGFLVRLVRSNGIRRVLCGRAASVNRRPHLSSSGCVTGPSPQRRGSHQLRPH
jgi:hypothetical protein